MNKEQKAAVIEEVSAQIKESEAIFAVDYRGLSVKEAADLREKLIEVGARFRVVKNSLTERAVDQAGVEGLKDLLEGPTAFTFVLADGGDAATAAKVLAQFRRQTDTLAFKGGTMNGQPLTVEQVEAISKLASREVLQSQLVGIIASPITGLVRGLGSLISGLAIALEQIREKGLVSGEAPAPPPEATEEAPAAEDAPEAEPETPEPEPEPSEAPGDPVAEGEAAEAETQAEDSETSTDNEE
jgi:large subunit ribosomal protein L10